MISLRDYQHKAIDLTRNAFRNTERRVMLVGPPGAGKGTIIGKMAVDAARKGMKVLIFMHKRELVLQQARRIVDQFGFKQVGFYLSGVDQRRQPIMVGTVQTMNRRVIRGDFDLVILDECHRIKTKQHQNIVEQFHNKYFIGFTATPFRGDKKGFADDFDTLIQFTTYNELVKQKALVPTKIIAPDVGIDLEGIKLRRSSDGKDYADDELFQKYNHDRVYKSIVETWIQHARDRKTIFFSVNSKEHAKTLAEYFRKYKISCHSIDSDCSKEERTKLFNGFANNEYQVLVNIGLFTEGISIDDVDCIGFAVATQVATKWVQAATRGSRPVWNEDYSDWKMKDGVYQKEDCLILDYGMNNERFGYVDDYDVVPFTLAGTPPKFGEVAMRECPQCHTMNYVQTRVCKECGYQFPVTEKEKNEAYADEVKWKQVDRLQTFWKKFQEIPYSKLMSSIEVNPHLIRLAAKAKGYKPQWAVHMAYKLGFIEENPLNNPVGMAKGFAFLKKCEEAKGITLLDELEKLMEENDSQRQARQSVS